MILMAYMDSATFRLIAGFVRDNVRDENYVNNDGCHPTSYIGGRIMSFRQEESGRERHFYMVGNEFHTRELDGFCELFRILVETNMLVSDNPEERMAAHRLLLSYATEGES